MKLVKSVSKTWFVQCTGFSNPRPPPLTTLLGDFFGLLKRGFTNQVDY